MTEPIVLISQAVLPIVKDFGFPATLVFVLLWRVIPALDEIKKALWTLSDADKTRARFTPLMDAQAERIVADVQHDVRSALQPVIIAIATRPKGES